MPAANFNILIDQGATFSQTLSLLTIARLPLDLTGFTARSKIRKNYTDEDPLATFTMTIESPATDGRITMSLSATITASIPATTAVYDVEIESGGGVVTRIMQGKAIISPEATK